MTRTRIRILLAVLLTVALALALAACGGDDDSAAGTAGTTAAADCSRAALPLVSSGKLTVGADKPAFPPYIIDNDPTNGKGFESATAYAIADKLGFAPADVAWIVVPFNSTFAPGAAKFDFVINQVSITPARQKQVDFSTPYYTTPQAVLVGKGSKYAGATTFAELSDAQIGVQVGTTSLDAVNDVIKPSKQPRVYNDSNDVVRALKSGQVDAIVVDLPTALSSGTPRSTAHGRRPVPGPRRRRLGRGAEEGLRAHPVRGRGDRAGCADSGELQKITEQWIGAEAVPELQLSTSPAVTAASEARLVREAARRRRARRGAAIAGDLVGGGAGRPRAADRHQPGVADVAEHVLRLGRLHARRSRTCCAASGST